uniref:Transposase, mutator type n=1 Tax=Tanacetum cinerariifolium TaxID=118510 RepID=A0A6L2MAE0_TANCI|nr:transposase, mutator type [Tanacetum cinerariifolium]
MRVVEEGVGPIGNFKEFEVDTDNETEEKSADSDTEVNDTSGSDSKDLDYDLKHDEVFDDNEHIIEDVHVIMNNFHLNPNPKHDLSIVAVKVHEDDLDFIDYDLFSSELDDGINYERITQLRELKRIGKKKNQGPNNVFAMGKNVFSQTKGSLVIRENNISGKHNFLGKDKTVKGKGKRWEVRTLIEDHKCLQLREIKACTSKFLSDHVIKTLASNPGPYPGQILTTIEVDANNRICPVAYDIVEAESKASWCWFLNLLGENLAIDYIVDWNGGYLYRVTGLIGINVLLTWIEGKGCKGQGGASQSGGFSQHSQVARQAAGARNVSSKAVSLGCSGNTTRIMRRTLMVTLVFTLCEEQVILNSVLMRLIDDLLALDSIVRFGFSDRRLERTATFSISSE